VRQGIVHRNDRLLRVGGRRWRIGLRRGIRAAIALPIPRATAKAPTRPIVMNFAVSNMAARPYSLVDPEFSDPALRRGPGYLAGTLMWSDQQLLLNYRGHNITSCGLSQVIT
jgi:hypothetical protein